MKLFQDEDEEIGEVFQDETNMAALLFYKQGGSDEYRMVRHHELNATKLFVSVVDVSSLPSSEPTQSSTIHAACCYITSNKVCYLLYLTKEVNIISRLFS